MLHTIEVDQSIKIEQSGTTVLAFANGMSYAIVIPSDVKTRGLRELKARGKSYNVAHLMLFSACLFCLLKDHLDLCEQIIIDVEYEGKDADIKAFLLRYIWKIYPKFRADTIIFRRVGKKSPADHKARQVREGRDKKFRKITSKELSEVIG